MDWSRPARRSLQRIPEKVATAIVEFIYGSLTENSRRLGKPLTLGLAGLHSAGRGDYRVIYLINDEDCSVEIVAIEHRADAYRRRKR